MNVEQNILSDITVYMKYAKYVPEKKETRNMGRISYPKQRNAPSKISSIA